MSTTVIIREVGAEGQSGVHLLVQGVLLPIVVAIATYVVVDRLGEWRRRRMYSMLGCALMDSLLEEIRTGLRTMEGCLEAINNSRASGPPPAMLPNAMWKDATVVGDDVLLRILQTSRGRTYSGFHPRDLRSHCKNYFVHMTGNYNGVLQHCISGGANAPDWRSTFQGMLAGDGGYLNSTRRVEALLVTSRELLSDNARRWFPR